MSRLNSATDTQPAQAATQPNPEYQLVSGPRLLEILFEEGSRPTLRWLRDQQKARRIPHTKVGRLVFFIPAAVRHSLQERNTIRQRSVAGGVH